MVRDVAVVGRGRAGETATAASFIDVEVATATDLNRGYGAPVGGRGCAGPGTMASVFPASVAGRTCVGVFGWSFGRGDYFRPRGDRLFAALQFAAAGNYDVGQGSVFGIDRHFGNPFEDFGAGYNVPENSMFGI